MSKYIYADNAATTQLDPDAFEAMKEFFIDAYGNPSQPYSFSRKAKKALKDSREIIANCINAEPDEIYFTSGGTESDNWALKGFSINQNRKGIIVSPIEHHAVINAVKSLESDGFNVNFLKVTTEGIVLPSFLESVIDADTGIVSVMLANNEIGSIQPVKELAQIAHNSGSVFHTDAVQAVGHLNIDVKDLQVDMLSASAHKFNGPKGIGFLYIKEGTSLQTFMDGGAQERRLRAGTENVPSIVGMAIALKKNCEQIEKVTYKLRRMESAFLDVLEKAGIDYRRNGSGNSIPGIINISIKRANGEMLLHRLDLKHIYISTGSACDSQNTQVSHVIKAINVPEEYSEGTIRISFGKNNDYLDAENMANTIVKIID